MKKSVKIAIIAVVVVLVVVGSITAIFWSNISNAIARATKTPEEYYVYVEKSNLETTTSTFYSLLNLGDSKKEFKEGTKFSVKMEMGDGISDVADLVLGSSESIKWLKSVEFSGVAHVSNDLISGTFKGTLNEKDIVEASMLTDIKNENMYFNVPLLTGDKFIKISNDASEGETSDDLLGGLIEDNPIFSAISELDKEDVDKILPSEKVFAELLVKYFNVLVNNLGEASTYSDTLVIDGVSQSCTLITLKVDEKDFYNGIKAVLNEVKTDEEIEKIVRAYAVQIEEDPDQFMDDFVKTVFFAIEEIDMRLSSLSEKTESEIAEEEVTLKTWVDNKGNIVARKFGVKKGEFFLGNAKKGSDLATEVYFKDEEGKEIVKFTGKGTLKGDKLSGNYALKFEDKEIIKVNVADFDLGALEDDYEVYGKFTVSVGSDLVETVFGESEVSEEILNLVKTAEIKFDFGKKAFAFEIATNNKTCIKISASETKIDYADSVIPEESKTVDITDEEALGEMLAEFNVETIINKLIEAGVPQELIDGMTAEDDYEDWGDEDLGDFEDYENTVEPFGEL